MKIIIERMDKKTDKIDKKKMENLLKKNQKFDKKNSEKIDKKQSLQN